MTTSNRPLMTPNINYTRDLTDAQQHLAEEYVRLSRTPHDDEYKAGYEGVKHGCEVVFVFITDGDGDDYIADAEFYPQELRDWTVEIGQTFYDNDRLDESAMTALHRFQLIADYADGSITRSEVIEMQNEFEENSDFVTSSLDSLRFRKNPDEMEASA